MEICWRCHKTFIPNSATGNCLYCGYSQDIDNVIQVKLKQAKHDRWEGNQQSYGADDNYRIKKKWSKGYYYQK